MFFLFFFALFEPRAVKTRKNQSKEAERNQKSILFSCFENPRLFSGFSVFLKKETKTATFGCARGRGRPAGRAGAGRGAGPAPARPEFGVFFVIFNAASPPWRTAKMGGVTGEA